MTTPPACPGCAEPCRSPIPAHAATLLCAACSSVIDEPGRLHRPHLPSNGVAARCVNTRRPLTQPSGLTDRRAT